MGLSSLLLWLMPFSIAKPTHSLTLCVTHSLTLLHAKRRPAFFDLKQKHSLINMPKSAHLGDRLLPAQVLLAAARLQQGGLVLKDLKRVLQALNLVLPARLAVL